MSALLELATAIRRGHEEVYARNPWYRALCRGERGWQVGALRLCEATGEVVDMYDEFPGWDHQEVEGYTI